jgi:dolichol-phosphate mannosyltransferase
MIYILLPAFNEEQNIPSIFEDIQKQRFNFPYRIILINDGSTDNTLSVAESFRNILPLTILSHNNNMGLGKALQTGFNFGSGEVLKDDAFVVLDSDNTHPVSLIPLMKEKIDSGYDVVIASRYTQKGSQSGLALYRKLLSISASLLFRVFLPIKGVSDYSCGYRMYSGRVIEKIVKAFGKDFISEKGFAGQLEILLKAGKCTESFSEVPLQLDYSKKQGKSKMKVFETILRYFALIYRLKCLKA